MEVRARIEMFRAHQVLLGKSKERELNLRWFRRMMLKLHEINVMRECGLDSYRSEYG